MKLSDIIFDYEPQSEEASAKPFRVLGDPHLRIIDRRIRRTLPSDEGNETYYEYEVLVSGFDAFPDGLNLEWHLEDEVWKDIEDFYVPRRCATYDNA